MTNNTNTEPPRLYAFRRCLDGTFHLSRVTFGDRAVKVVDAKFIRALYYSCALADVTPRAFLMETVHMRDTLPPGNETWITKEFHVMSPALRYVGRDGTLYIVPLRSSVLKLPMLESYEVFEPGGGYINLTHSEERAKPEEPAQ